MPALTALRRHADTNCTIVPICEHGCITGVHTKHATICATDRNSVEMHAPRQSLPRPHFAESSVLNADVEKSGFVLKLYKLAEIRVADTLDYTSRNQGGRPQMKFPETITVQ